MLFNSYQFIFLFLPITFIVYFYLNHKRFYKASLLWLVCASLFFYSYWNIAYLPLLLLSISFNFIISGFIIKYTSLNSNNSTFSQYLKNSQSFKHILYSFQHEQINKEKQTQKLDSTSSHTQSNLTSQDTNLASKDSILTPPPPLLMMQHNLIKHHKQLIFGIQLQTIIKHNKQIRFRI